MSSKSISDAGGLGRQKALADALSGVLASVVSLVLFYPIDVIKTRVTAGTMKHQRLPLAELFASLPVKALHTTSSSFCYFLFYSWIVSWYARRNRGKRQRISATERLVLSAVAAMLNTLLTLPLDVISSRLQTAKKREEPPMTNHPTAATSLLERSQSSSDNETEDESVSSLSEDNEEEEEKWTKNEATTVLRRQGPETSGRWSWTELFSLWKGLYPSLLLCSNPAINYTIFDTIKHQIGASSSKTDDAEASLSIFSAFVLGLCAKFAATICTYPLIRAKVLLMVTERTSLLGCLIDEYQRHGFLRGLYKGCYLQLLHTLLKSALLMVVRERIKHSTRRLVLRRDTTAN